MKKVKLLIVEDNFILNEVIYLALKDEFDCQTAYDGSQGIELLEWADCISVDGEFPHNTEFYAALKSAGKPFVTYSGNEQYAGKGEKEFILKPNLKKLVASLQRLFL